MGTISYFRHRYLVAFAGALLLLEGGCVERDESHEELVSTAESEIRNGEVADPEEWPAFATITFETPPIAGGPGVLVCSGALIAPDVVLTAAACTVCATGATVKLLGKDQLVSAAPGGISFNDGAFVKDVNFEPTPTPVDCTVFDWTFDAWDKLDFGAGRNVGIVKLATPIDPGEIAPMKVMLDAPHGFSPVQDLFGSELCLVRRIYG